MTQVGDGVLRRFETWLHWSPFIKPGVNVNGTYILWRQPSCPEATAQGGIFNFRQDGPRRFEHATLSLIMSERYPTSFLKQCGRRINRILTKSTIASCICSVLQEKFYPSRIVNVNELKTRLIDEWDRFYQSIMDTAIEQWRRRFSTCVRVSRAHFEHQFKRAYKISYFVIYLPKVIKLMKSWRVLTE